jgi:hypothetical protein
MDIDPRVTLTPAEEAEARAGARGLHVKVQSIWSRIVESDGPEAVVLDPASGEQLHVPSEAEAEHAQIAIALFAKAARVAVEDGCAAIHDESERPTEEERAELARRLGEHLQHHHEVQRINPRGGARAVVVTVLAEMQDAGVLGVPEIETTTPEAALRAALRLGSQATTGGALWVERIVLAHSFPSILRLWQRENAPRLAARAVLLEARAGGDDLAADERARIRLAGQVEELLLEVEALLELPKATERPSLPSPIPLVTWATADDAAPIITPCTEDVPARTVPLDEAWLLFFASATSDLDGELADLLEGRGQRAREQAVAIRAKAHAVPAWVAWWEKPLRVAKLLARSLWTDSVRPRLEREAQRMDTAGIAFPVLNNLVAVSRRGAQTTLLDSEQRTAELRNRQGQRIGSLRVAPLIDERHVSLAALGKLTTQRLIRHVLWEGYRRKWIDEEPDPGRIVIEGGYSALADILGMKGRKAADELKVSVATLASIYINTPTEEGQVFSAYHYKAHTGQAARLEMTLLGPFAPDYIARQLAGHRNPSDKWLVPIPLPRLLPPFVGERRNEDGAQAMLQVLALRELRVRAEEMAENGSVEISERRWMELADEASVPRRLLPLILDVYPRGDGDHPAFLERPGAWTFRLTDAYGAERRAIMHAASAQRVGRAGGKASRAAVKKRRLPAGH